MLNEESKQKIILAIRELNIPIPTKLSIVTATNYILEVIG